jgi:hypothetical protein
MSSCTRLFSSGRTGNWFFIIGKLRLDQQGVNHMSTTHMSPAEHVRQFFSVCEAKEGLPTVIDWLK